MYRNLLQELKDAALLTDEPDISKKIVIYIIKKHLTKILAVKRKEIDTKLSEAMDSFVSTGNEDKFQVDLNDTRDCLGLDIVDLEEKAKWTETLDLCEEETK